MLNQLSKPQTQHRPRQFPPIALLLRRTALQPKLSGEKDKIKKDAKDTLTQILPLVEASHRKVKTLGETVVPESGDLARALQEIEQLLERIS